MIPHLLLKMVNYHFALYDSPKYMLNNPLKAQMSWLVTDVFVDEQEKEQKAQWA